MRRRQAVGRFGSALTFAGILLIGVMYAAPSSAQETAKTRGVLVAAHGGGAAWNASVVDATKSLAACLPTVVAFGMAEPRSLKTALDSLESQGVQRVAVVRLFISGTSFKPQYDYLLGLSDEHPGWFMLMDGSDPADVQPISHGLDVYTHNDGLMDSKAARQIVVDRVTHASETPSEEHVLLIAHGMGDEGDNQQVLDAMQLAADDLRAEGYQDVRVEALREDWLEEREDAEVRIREYVKDGDAEGRRVIVVPYRLSGFGPYAEVLEGLEYVATDGLTPHAAVADWIEDKARSLLSVSRETTDQAAKAGARTCMY